MSKMKLEVGKRYETRDGRVAFMRYYNKRTEAYFGHIAGDDEPRKLMWFANGARVSISVADDLVRCLDDEPELEEPTYTMPTVDPKVWAAMPGAKAIAWDDGVGSMYAYTEVPRRGSSAWGRCDGQMSRIRAELFGDLIQRGDCPWDQAIVLRPEGL